MPPPKKQKKNLQVPLAPETMIGPDPGGGGVSFSLQKSLEPNVLKIGGHGVHLFSSVPLYSRIQINHLLGVNAEAIGEVGTCISCSQFGGINRTHVDWERIIIIIIINITLESRNTRLFGRSHCV